MVYSLASDYQRVYICSNVEAGLENYIADGFYAKNYTVWCLKACFVEVLFGESVGFM